MYKTGSLDGRDSVWCSIYACEVYVFINHFVFTFEWFFNIHRIVVVWLISICVRALKVPMHLSLINRPFVAHNLMSAQGNHVPLIKFQMATRLKTLNVLWVQGKGTQIRILFFSQKVPVTNPLQVFHRCSMSHEITHEDIIQVKFLPGS